MECPKCGYLMQPFDKQCPRCHHDPAVAAAPKAPPPEAQERPSPAGRGGKRNKKPPSMPVAVTLLVCSLVCTVGGIVYFVAKSAHPIPPAGMAPRPPLPAWPQWLLWAAAVGTAYVGLKMVKALQKGQLS